MKRGIVWLILCLLILPGTAFSQAKDYSGTYTHENDPNEFLELRRDGTFLITVKDFSRYSSASGKYRVEGGRLILELPTGQAEIAKIDGNKITNPGGQIFVKKNGRAISIQRPSLQNLKSSCASNTRSVCVWIHEMTSSTCKAQDQCANAMIGTLRSNDLTFSTAKLDPYDQRQMGAFGYRSGCIGYRGDLGGTKEGAVALAKLLGETQYFVDDSACNASGFRYNVIRR